MNIKKYKATALGAHSSIVIVECVKETDSCVWFEVSGLRKLRRVNKLSDYESYFDTWAEAKQHLVTLANDGVDRAEQSLEFRKQVSKNVAGLVEPA